MLNLEELISRPSQKQMVGVTPLHSALGLAAAKRQGSTEGRQTLSFF